SILVSQHFLQSLFESFLFIVKLQTSQAGLLGQEDLAEFFLFSLYDYDRSGQMDGLELMQLLTDFLSYQAIRPKSTDSVVSLVDHLLQTQDLNQDGLLAPSELLSYTLDHEQENNIVPPEVQAEMVEETNREHTDTKTEGGDPEIHLQEAEVQETEQDQLVDHENETQPAQQHGQVEDPRDLNQIPEQPAGQQL
ncbi:hypothetical protein IRJ41_006099, partial [Triplophysa rosa]